MLAGIGAIWLAWTLVGLMRNPYRGDIVQTAISPDGTLVATVIDNRKVPAFATTSTRVVVGKAGDELRKAKLIINGRNNNNLSVEWLNDEDLQVTVGCGIFVDAKNHVTPYDFRTVQVNFILPSESCRFTEYSDSQP